LKKEARKMKKVIIVEAENGWAVRFNDDVPLKPIDKFAIYASIRELCWELLVFFGEDPEELLK